jgi:hypothetical protein
MSASQSSDCRYGERLDASSVIDERTLAAVVDVVAPGVSLSRDGDDTRAPTLTMLTSVDGLGGQESTAAAAALRASASEHMDMSAQKTARTELKLLRGGASEVAAHVPARLVLTVASWMARATASRRSRQPHPRRRVGPRGAPTR